MTHIKGIPTAFTPVFFDSIDSTNEEAKRRALLGEEQTPEGTLIIARRQESGRGRGTRTWVSATGNLYMSVVLRPNVPLSRAAEFGFVAALALYDTVGEMAAPMVEARIKWPNDILLNGAKVSGILLDSDGNGNDTNMPAWLVVGMGLNVTHAPTDTPFPATSMKAEGLDNNALDDADTEATVTRTAVCLCRHFLHWCGVWRDRGFAPIRTMWLNRTHPIGTALFVRQEQTALEGIFQGISDTGALLLQVQGTTHTIHAGDVYFPSSASPSAP